MEFPTATLTASEVRTGDVIVAGHVLASRSRAGKTTITLDGVEEPLVLPKTATVLATHLAERTSSLA